MTASAIEVAASHEKAIPAALMAARASIAACRRVQIQRAVRPALHQQRERVSARAEPGDAGRDRAAQPVEQGDRRPREEPCYVARQAEGQQRDPAQEAHQGEAGEIEPVEDALDLEAAGVAFLGHLIMRKPTLLLAELIGHSRHEVLGPHDSGLGGRNRVEPIARTSHEWCSLKRA